MKKIVFIAVVIITTITQSCSSSRIGITNEQKSQIDSNKSKMEIILNKETK